MIATLQCSLILNFLSFSFDLAFNQIDTKLSVFVEYDIVYTLHRVTNKLQNL